MKVVAGDLIAGGEKQRIQRDDAAERPRVCRGRVTTLIKKKRKFSSYIKNIQNGAVEKVKYN